MSQVKNTKSSANTCDLDAPDCLLKQLTCTESEIADSTICTTCQQTVVEIEAQAMSLGSRLAASPKPKSGELPSLIVAEFERIREMPDELRRTEKRALRNEEKTNQTRDSTPFPKLTDYLIIREIGRGGMGVVYQARQLKLKRLVALKVLPQNSFINNDAVVRFEREAAAAASLHHTNIVPVYESGNENGVCFYAMQLIEGDSLDVIRDELCQSRSQAAVSTAAFANAETLNEDTSDDIAPIDNQSEITNREECDTTLADGELPNPPQLQNTRPASRTSYLSNPTARIPYTTSNHYRFVADVGQQAASALHYSHERGIIHRDVKPSNLILDIDGVVWLADFGLAKHLGDDLTATQAAPGTLRYMSPERFRGQVGATSDVYSLGASMYELLTLKPAFTSTDPLSLLSQIKSVDPTRPKTLDRNVPLDLQTIVMKSMAKEPSDRYATALALKEDLQRFLRGESILARQASSIEKLFLWGRRNPIVALLTATLLATLVAITIASTYAAILFKDLAEKETKAAQTASEATRQATLNLYHAETNLAGDGIESAAGVTRIRDYLKVWHPENDVQGVCGWEWHLLNSFANFEIGSKRYANDGGHPFTINSMNYTPDGKHLAIILSNEVLIVDAESREEVARLKGFNNWVLCQAFNHSGDLLAVGSENKSLTIWDWRKQKQVKKIETDLPVWSVAWHPDDLELVFHISGNYGSAKSLNIVDASTWSIEKTIDDNIGAVIRKLGYSKNGAYFCSSINASSDALQVWDCSNWTAVASMKLKTKNITTIDWHPDNQTIACGSSEGHAYLWNFVTDKSQQLIKLDDHLPHVAWSPDGSYLALSGWDGSLQFWDHRRQQMGADFPGHEARLFGTAWHPIRNFIVSADWNGIVKTWKWDRPTAVTTAPSHLEKTGDYRRETTLQWHPDGNQIVAGNKIGSVIWNLQTVNTMPLKDAKQFSSRTPVFTDAGTLITQSNGHALIWDGEYQTHTSVKTWNELSLVGSTRDSLFYSNWRPNVPVSFHQFLLKERKLRALPGHFASVTDVSASPDGRLLSVCGIAEGLSIYDLESYKEVAELNPFGDKSIWTSHWNRQAPQLAIAGKEKKIEIWDTDSWTREQMLSGHTSDINSVQWNPTSNRLASGASDRTVRIWDTQTWRTSIVLNHVAEVIEVAWSPDGKKLAAFASDGTLRVWDTSLSYRETDSIGSESLEQSAGAHLTENSISEDDLRLVEKTPSAQAKRAIELPFFNVDDGGATLESLYEDHFPYTSVEHANGKFIKIAGNHWREHLYDRVGDFYVVSVEDNRITIRKKVNSTEVYIDMNQREIGFTSSNRRKKLYDVTSATKEESE